MADKILVLILFVLGYIFAFYMGMSFGKTEEKINQIKKEINELKKEKEE